jgi:hypothetical protein
MFHIFVYSRNPAIFLPFVLVMEHEGLADRACILFRRAGYQSWVTFI